MSLGNIPVAPPPPPVYPPKTSIAPPPSSAPEDNPKSKDIPAAPPLPPVYLPNSPNSPNSSKRLRALPKSKIPRAPPAPPVYIPNSPNSGSRYTCGICLEDHLISSFPAEKCGQGHQFCQRCLSKHFAYCSQEGNPFRCPLHSSCGLNFPNDVVQRLLQPVGGFTLKPLREQLMAVKDGDWVFRCENSICLGVVIGEVFSDCVLLNCLSCGTCSKLGKKEMKKYKKIHKKSNLTLEQKLDAFYLSRKTRSCPSCHKVIERNEGCPHMTCVCGKGFCWNCGGKYHHGPITVLTGKHNSKYGILGCSQILYPENKGLRIATRSAILVGGVTAAVTLGPPVLVGGLIFVAAPYGIYRGVKAAMR